MRRLTAALEDRVCARLDARLDAGAGAPLAVALSGGGDSLALTLMAAEWARRRDRPLVVLTVDHGLRPESAFWSQACAGIARRLGARFRALAWTSAPPASGLPAAARQARHRLLAAAAREAGARVILMGHTGDDLAEAEVMRGEGGSTPSPREWSPSPAWPEGRGVFLLRPLLSAGRTELRDWLSARGETWIDDPANTDLRFARSRARLTLSKGVPQATVPPRAPAGEACAAGLARAVRETAFGLALDRGSLRRAGPGAGLKVTAAACLSASGGLRPPRRAAVEDLYLRLAGTERVQATLGGALVCADDAQVLWGRSAGEMRRQGAADLVLAPGERGVFDGRFEVDAVEPVLIGALAGRMARLSPKVRAGLAQIPPRFRGGLPVAESASGLDLPPGREGGVQFRTLAGARLAAACGGMPRESLIRG